MKTFLKKYYLRIVGTLAVTSFVFIFQNCSQVKIVPAPKPVFQTVAVNLNANVCPRDPFPQSAGPTKFVFVVDMSRSNVGAFVADPTITIGGVHPQFFDPSSATDADGSRFKAILDFLDNCANSANSEYAVIGFSNQAGLAMGSGASAVLTATNLKFTNSQDAKAAVNGLINIQKEEKTLLENWIKNADGSNYFKANEVLPPILQGTSYHNAFTVTNDLVETDITSSTTQNYFIFFLTDGKPADQKDQTCGSNQIPSDSGRQKCQKDMSLASIDSMRLGALASTKKLLIQTIFYGAAEGSVVPDLLNVLSAEGGTERASQLNSFSASYGQSNANPFCTLLNAEIATNYQLDNFSIINLTAFRKNGKQVVDSDMDGISDDDAVKLGLDPFDPRSSWRPLHTQWNSIGPADLPILNSICQKLGGVDICMQKYQELISTTTCSSVVGPTLLNECEIKLLGLKPNGVDSDNDGMPDYIEIIRGTDPNSADMVDDPDGDKLTNRREIQRGSDLFTTDNDIPDSLLNSFTIAFDASNIGVEGCTNGVWNIKVNQLQYAQTKAVSAWPNYLPMNHSDNEQVLMIIYRDTPQNSATQGFGEFHIKIVRVPVSGDSKNGVQSMQSEPSYTPSSFENWGGSQ